MVLTFIGMLVIGCGSGSEETTDDSSSGGELAIGVTRVGRIVNEVDVNGTTEGTPDVDLYHINVDQTQPYLRVYCDESSATAVDLLVVAYDGRPQPGGSNRIFGVQKDEDNSQAAEIDFLIPIAETSGNIYITVRDLMDDDKHNTQTQAYRLTVSYATTFGGPDNVQNITELILDTTTTGNIADCNFVNGLSFSPVEDGVYKFYIDPPSTDSPVQLVSRLYDATGSRLQRVNAPSTTILAYLTVANAPYLLTSQDADKSGRFTDEPYTVTVTQVDSGLVDEALTNDTSDTPTVLTAEGGIFTATGSIDYNCSSNLATGNAGDRDWYRFTVGDGDAETVYHQVQITMDNDGENDPAIIRATVYADPGGTTPIIAHQFHTFGDSYEPFLNQFRAQTGTYYLMVEDVSVIAGTGYTVTLQEAGLTSDEDTYEQIDENHIDTARALPLTTTDPTMISYVGDVDWYSVDVDTTTPQILSVYLDSAASEVDYELGIWVDGDSSATKRVADLDGTDGATHLKTSIYIPAGEGGGSITYYIKVADAQSNDGSAEPYEISADVALIPTDISCVGAPSAYYYNEATEQARANSAEVTFTTEDDDLQIDIYSNYTPKFVVNTNRLDFQNATSEAVIDDTTNTITFPWIGGYIDYQGDHDVFKVNFSPMTDVTTWYYDVKIELKAPCADGSHVEYVWKLYQDGNGDATANNRVIDYPPGEDDEGNAYNTDGYKACAGDTTPSDSKADEPYNTSQTIDIVTPDDDDRTFYIPSEDSDGVAADNDSQFFLSISDMVFQKLPDTGNNNDRSSLDDVPWKDDDWGYDGSPYFFRVTLTYHPGETSP